MAEERPYQRGEALVEITFRILGPTALRVRGHFEQEWTHPKPRGMLAALLLYPRQSVSVNELVGLMWAPDKVPQDPVGTLYSYNKRVRAGLEQLSDPPKIRVVNGIYRIDVDRDQIDPGRYAWPESATSR